MKFYWKTGEVYKDMNYEMCLKIVENMEGIEEGIFKWLVIEMKVYVYFYHLIQ